MTIASTVLFDMPQMEIASLVEERMSRSSATSIVSGFATPGGLAAIDAPIRARPQSLKALVIGAATYPGFAALDGLIAAGVSIDRLHVHLGHTRPTGGRKNPFARFHPMLHSKVYYMELPESQACAFVGSHNLTSFALTGLNGEASVLLEGSSNSPEFKRIRSHIDTARNQAVPYSPGMKEAFAWWSREFIDGLRAEMHLPQDWEATRTILLFASAKRFDRPKPGEQLYFEIPAGIEQLVSLRTQTHLFLFDTLPANPWQAIHSARTADAQYVCKTLGAENLQGNVEVKAQWRIEASPNPVLLPVLTSTFRPNTPIGMQQVRVEISAERVGSFEYQFERERKGWDPEFSHDESLLPAENVTNEIAVFEAKGGLRSSGEWKLVQNLFAKEGSAREKDEEALKLAAPDSGAFILVSLRRRIKKTEESEID